MSRIATSYYGADADTTFAWATTDNDRFDRSQDLYCLAQAVEHHDHSSTRGLAVARIATGAIDEPAYGSLTVSTRALANLAVTTGKLADGAVTDVKLAIAKMPLAGGVMTGNLQIIPTATPTAGLVYLGNSGSYVGYDGSSLVLSHAAGGRIYSLGDVWIYRPGGPSTGYSFYGNAGHYFGFDGTNFVVDGQIVRTILNTADAPLGGMVAFRTAAELTAAGARWARETNANGRLLLGAGQAGGIAEVFTENTFYGTTWAVLTYMGYSVNTGSLAAVLNLVNDTVNVFNAGVGGTQVNTSGHAHAGSSVGLTGVLGQVNAGVSYLPPSLAVVWGRRVS